MLINPRNSIPNLVKKAVIENPIAQKILFSEPREALILDQIQSVMQNLKLHRLLLEKSVK